MAENKERKRKCRHGYEGKQAVKEQSSQENDDEHPAEVHHLPSSSTMGNKQKKRKRQEYESEEEGNSDVETELNLEDYDTEGLVGLDQLPKKPNERIYQLSIRLPTSVCTAKKVSEEEWLEDPHVGKFHTIFQPPYATSLAQHHVKKFKASDLPLDLRNDLFNCMPHRKIERRQLAGMINRNFRSHIVYTHYNPRRFFRTGRDLFKKLGGRDVVRYLQREARKYPRVPSNEYPGFYGTRSSIVREILVRFFAEEVGVPLQPVLKVGQVEKETVEETKREAKKRKMRLKGKKMEILGEFILKEILVEFDFLTMEIYNDDQRKWMEGRGRQPNEDDLVFFHPGDEFDDEGENEDGASGSGKSKDEDESEDDEEGGSEGRGGGGGGGGGGSGSGRSEGGKRDWGHGRGKWSGRGGKGKSRGRGRGRGRGNVPYWHRGTCRKPVKIVKGERLGRNSGKRLGLVDGIDHIDGKCLGFCGFFVPPDVCCELKNKMKSLRIVMVAKMRYTFTTDDDEETAFFNHFFPACSRLAVPLICKLLNLFSLERIDELVMMRLDPLYKESKDPMGVVEIRKSVTLEQLMFCCQCSKLIQKCGGTDRKNVSVSDLSKRNSSVALYHCFDGQYFDISAKTEYCYDRPLLCLARKLLVSCRDSVNLKCDVAPPEFLIDSATVQHIHGVFRIVMFDVTARLTYTNVSTWCRDIYWSASSSQISCQEACRAFTLRKNAHCGSSQELKM